MSNRTASVGLADSEISLFRERERTESKRPQRHRLGQSNRMITSWNKGSTGIGVSFNLEVVLKKYSGVTKKVRSIFGR